MITTKTYKLFDSHFHIIDKKFPLVENQGFLPEYFSCDSYHKRLSEYNLAGGVIVSGSFQGLDQSYLLQALNTLGPNYVGVTQLPMSGSDEEIIRLDEAGVRGVRFNLKRGGSEGLENLEKFAHRIHEVAGWHAELYVDSKELSSLSSMLL
jgi:predicted TIM-barrel fold metal-dependent hydrolase